MIHSFLLDRRFHHENIVTYYGTCARYDERGESLQYIMVMEHCETTLRARISGPDSLNPGKLGSHNLCWGRAVKMMIGYIRQMSSALLYLHARVLVHRDLKPANILVRKPPCKSSYYKYYCYLPSAKNSWKRKESENSSVGYQLVQINTCAP